MPVSKKPPEPEKVHGVFYPKIRTEIEGGPIGAVLGKSPVKGEVGLEIEVEGRRLLHDEDVPEPWVYHVDHSLRGENAEYVLDKPISFKEVPKALKTLWDALNSNKAVLKDSNRTSVHVHLNCQQFHLNRLASFLGLIFSLEEPLTEWCGEHRVGNLFCLRAIDAPGIISAFRNFIQNNGQTSVGEYLRYAAVNPHALLRFGSLEIRTLKGCSDPKIIEEWVSILERLYKLSEDFKDPRDVCTTLSSLGPLGFFDRMLGEKATVIRQGISWTDDELREAVYRGVRLAQDICYCREWELYKPIEIRMDPFGRKGKKTLSEATLAVNPSVVVNNNGVLQTWVEYTNTLLAQNQAQLSQPQPGSVYITPEQDSTEEEQEFEEELDYDDYDDEEDLEI